MPIISDKFLDQATRPLVEIVEQTNNEVLGIIANRIKQLWTLSPSDVNRVIALAKIDDVKAIQTALALMSDRSVAEIDSIFHKVAAKNDELATTLYNAANVPQVAYSQNVIMSAIVQGAIKNAKNDMLNISATTAFDMGDRLESVRAAYNHAIDKAAFQVSQGVVDYNTSIRKTVTQLADSGLHTVDFKSGAHRRLDSAVRMNIMDGVRSMSDTMRSQQGKEFGADGVEISVHGLCAPDHQHIQGKQYPLAEWERVNANLDRQIGTLNCKHKAFPVLLGISESTYTDDELATINDKSNEIVEFKSISGKDMSLSRYDATQYRAALDLNRRKQVEIRDALKKAGDSTGAKRVNLKCRELNKSMRNLTEVINA